MGGDGSPSGCIYGFSGVCTVCTPGLMSSYKCSFYYFFIK